MTRGVVEHVCPLKQKKGFKLKPLKTLYTKHTALNHLLESLILLFFAYYHHLQFQLFQNCILRMSVCATWGATEGDGILQTLCACNNYNYNISVMILYPTGYKK